MHYFPAALQDLADQFARLPGIGSKTAQRLAFFVLSQTEEEAMAFANAIVDAAYKMIELDKLKDDDGITCNCAVVNGGFCTVRVACGG